jgi:hypothetical protein
MDQPAISSCSAIHAASFRRPCSGVIDMAWGKLIIATPAV